MNKSSITRRRNKIIKETKENMMRLGTYKEEFDVVIRRYAEMRMQFDKLNEQWYEKGCLITEDYTNKNGSTNKRKTALYLSIESIRKELLEMENIFGLTPKGLKQIQTNSMKVKKKSKLDDLLSV